MGGRRILVVDDCVDTVECVSTLLEVLGHECRGAVSGAEAIREVVTFKPDIVLLDLMLPDVSGLDVACTLRARFDRSLYLAAMTGWQSEHNRELLRACGFDERLLKPFDKAALCRVVDHPRAVASYRRNRLVN